VEMLRASGEAIGTRHLLWYCEGRMHPDDPRKSLIVNVHKGKGDSPECGSYRGIELLDHVLRVLERVV